MTELDNDVLNKIKAEVLKVLGENVPEQYLNPTDDIEMSAVDNLEYRRAAVNYIVFTECLMLMHSPLADEHIKEHIKDYSRAFLDEYLGDCVNKSKKEIIAMYTDYINKQIHKVESTQILNGNELE